MKYIILGNIMGFSAIASIASAGYDWRLSAIFGVISGVIGNYLFFDIKRKLMYNIKTLVDSIGGYVGIKFENGSIVRIDGEIKTKKRDVVDELGKVLGDEDV